MALADHDLVHRSRLATVTREELLLLDSSIDVYVVALLECLGDTGKFSVEAEAIPVRQFAGFSAVSVSDALAHPDVGDGSTRRQAPHLWRLRDITCNHNPVHLHG